MFPLRVEMFISAPPMRCSLAPLSVRIVISCVCEDVAKLFIPPEAVKAGISPAFPASDVSSGVMPKFAEKPSIVKLFEVCR